MSDKQIISRACNDRWHISSKSQAYRCNGFAYPGGITDPPVQCDCDCHLGKLFDDAKA
jgi:hypothetical protein